MGLPEKLEEAGFYNGGVANSKVRSAEAPANNRRENCRSNRCK